MPPIDEPSQNSHYGTTPLHAAAHGDQKEVMQILLDHGASLRAKNLHGRMPLEETAVHNARGAAKLLAAALPGMSGHHASLDNVQRQDSEDRRGSPIPDHLHFPLFTHFPSHFHFLAGVAGSGRSLKKSNSFLVPIVRISLLSSFRKICGSARVPTTSKPTPKYSPSTLIASFASW